MKVYSFQYFLTYSTKNPPYDILCPNLPLANSGKNMPWANSLGNLPNWLIGKFPTRICHGIFFLRIRIGKFFDIICRRCIFCVIWQEACRIFIWHVILSLNFRRLLWGIYLSYSTKNPLLHIMPHYDIVKFWKEICPMANSVRNSPNWLNGEFHHGICHWPYSFTEFTCHN